ncbi:60S ribosomal protein L6-A [Curvularia clavata]|uniref:60S ribosomal protein L6-A n=1 Tax=Curvularia clavata TaxID=95742 RepID=A0A9Q9DXC7_CURCL|nr:60S ribosomal protein L6-A [Curvularia clavata]
MADQKASKYYPAEEEAQMKKARKTAHPTKYRDSLAPGTVLILLSGRFRGKRVVLLRQLDQGILLITGPFKSNGVPLRRVNHRYVIATSTVVDVSSVDADVIARVSEDAYWAREKKSGDEDAFFNDGGETPAKKDVDPQRIEDQKKVDKAVLASIKKMPDLEAYLSASFSLRGNERPHQMVF